MENSAEETERNQSFRSPPRRRRSTFFERRDSIVQNVMSEDNTNKKEPEENDQQIENMKRYCEKLQAEKDMWKKEANERREKYHELRQQYQMAVKASSRSRIGSYLALSKEDIEFLKAKPNLSILVESQQKLHKSVLVTQQLFKRASELEDVILTNSENVVDKITNYILDNSTVDGRAMGKDTA